MATSVTLPELGESVTEGTVTRWLKEVGDEVAVDEPLLEISTDKVDTEIPSPAAGTLLEQKVAEDETVEVGAELAVIGDSGESAGGDEGGADEATAEKEAEPEPEPEAEKEPEPEPEPEAEKESEPEPEPEPEPEKEPEPEPAGDQEPHLDTKQTGEGTAVVLPELGESVTEGTVTRWLKQVGDDVAVDEPLLEISTDKVDTEIPSPVAGTLVAIKADEDETVEVGAELAIIGEAGSSAPAEKEDEPEAKAEPEKEPEPEKKPEPEEKAEAEKEVEAEAEKEKEEVTEPESEPASTSSKPPAPEQAPTPPPQPSSGTSGDAGASGAGTQSGGDTYVTPIVRKLAKQHGVDLAAVTGTGVGGRIRKQDVLDAAEKAPQPSATATPAATGEPSPLRGKTEKLSRLRKTIATRMIESLQVSAQLTQVHEVDVTDIARLRARQKDAFLEREGVKLTFLPFFAKAAVEALKAHPKVNAALNAEEGTVTYPDGEHLGVAVDTERGLLVPTIRDAGDLSIAGLARKIADVAERTRTNKISPDEISGATFTVTNLGSNGALFDTPIINQPQVAILGVGAVVKRPVVMTDDRGGESIAVRSMAYLALTYDHRIIDGADAGRFLTAVKERLENGSLEAELGS